jgi:DNA mismatch repair protein MSH4
MDESALASYLKKLQTEFTIRMNIAADDDATEGSAGKNVEPAVSLPTLAKPSEEELEAWKKKCDAAENRVMHANMAQPDDKKRPSPSGEGTESLPKRTRMEDDSASTISQPTPINRGSMIEELRRGACTPTTRAATPSSIRTGFSDSQTDSVMHDVPVEDKTPREDHSQTENQQRAMPISSSSNYDEEIPDIHSPDVSLPTGVEQRPAAGVYVDLVQPLEQFQPLRDWYAREQAAEYSGATPRARSIDRNLGGARSATQEFLRGLHEGADEQTEGEDMEL